MQGELLTQPLRHGARRHGGGVASLPRPKRILHERREALATGRSEGEAQEGRSPRQVGRPQTSTLAQQVK